MTSMIPSAHPQKLPSLGLLALSLTLITYALNQTELIHAPVTSLGTVLLIGGGLQLLSGIPTRNATPTSANASFLPLGIFWLSLIGFDIFPELGFGRHPDAFTSVAYLSMWGLFAALLFLGSFRQSRALQVVFGALMICLLFLAMGKLRDNHLLLCIGGSAGLLSGLAAGYTALAQLSNQWAGRPVLPLGIRQGTLK